MEDQKRTNKPLLARGIKSLVGSLGAVAAGPIVTYNAFMNKDHELYLVALTVGIALLFLAIFLMARGIHLIMKSIFD